MLSVCVVLCSMFVTAVEMETDDIENKQGMGKKQHLYLHCMNDRSEYYKE